jgi:hypothetical protein
MRLCGLCWVVGTARFGMSAAAKLKQGGWEDALKLIKAQNIVLRVM